MSFCFALMTNDAGLLGPAMQPFAAALTPDRDPGHGWGIVFYQGGSPLMRKQPRAAPGAPDIRSRLGDLRTTLLLGHHHGQAVAERRTENTQPFRFRAWTFAHVGRVPGFDEIRDDLTRAMRGFVRRNVRGSTAEEHIFHLFCTYLADMGRLDDTPSDDEVMQALGSTIGYVDRLQAGRGREPHDFTLLLSNGRMVAACRRGLPLSVSRHSGYRNVGRTHEGRPISYPHLRAVAILGGKEPEGPGWESVRDGAVVRVNADLDIEYCSL